MKIKDIFQNVNKTNAEKVDVQYFAEEAFNINQYIHYIESERLIAYSFSEWLCTDTHVGHKAYFFDGEPVAIGSKLYRKSDEEFEWISKEAYKKVKSYIVSLIFLEEDEDDFEWSDLEQEIGDGYKLEFYSQLLQEHKENAILNGEKVKILRNDGNEYTCKNVEIQLPNGTKKYVPITDLLFLFNVKS